MDEPLEGPVVETISFNDTPEKLEAAVLEVTNSLLDDTPIPTEDIPLELGVLTTLEENNSLSEPKIPTSNRNSSNVGGGSQVSQENRRSNVDNEVERHLLPFPRFPFFSINDISIPKNLP